MQRAVMDRASKMYKHSQRPRFLVKVGGGGGDRGKSTQPTIIVKRFEHGPIKNIGGEPVPPPPPRPTAPGIAAHEHGLEPRLVLPWQQVSKFKLGLFALCRFMRY